MGYKYCDCIEFYTKCTLIEVRGKMEKQESNPQLKISELFGLIERVDGWLTHLEQIALLHLPVWVDYLPGEIIEIGSFKGKSTTALGLGSKWISKRKRAIYAIDPFMPDRMYHGNYFDDFLNNIHVAQLENYVIPIKKYSQDAIGDCPDQISALFVDGNHDYMYVKQDIQHYTPRVVPGGMIAFHDYSNFLDVKRAVDELCESKEYVYVCDYDSLRIIRKLN